MNSEQALEKALQKTQELGRMQLEDVRDLVHDEVPADEFFALGREFAEGFAKGKTNAQVLAGALAVIMFTLMEMSGVADLMNEPSAPKPRQIN